jgi:hypothetical protein
MALSGSDRVVGSRAMKVCYHTLARKGKEEIARIRSRVLNWRPLARSVNIEQSNWKSNEDLQMAPDELRDTLRRQPFQPFRLVMTDGMGYDIRHPDLLWVGRSTAHVGLTRQPDQTLFERVIYVDLSHVVRLEPLEAAAAPPKNGSAS